SSVGPVVGDTGSDNPRPRGSNCTTRLNDARRRWNRAIDGSSSTLSMEMNPIGSIRRAIGPSPTTWYARCRSRLFAYRIRGASTTTQGYVAPLPHRTTTRCALRRARGTGVPRGRASVSKGHFGGAELPICTQARRTERAYRTSPAGLRRRVQIGTYG